MSSLSIECMLYNFEPYYHSVKSVFNFTFTEDKYQYMVCPSLAFKIA